MVEFFFSKCSKNSENVWNQGKYDCEIFTKIWAKNNSLHFLKSENVTPSFSGSLRSKFSKKSGVTWFGERTPLRPGGRRTTKDMQTPLRPQKWSDFY